MIQKIVNQEIRKRKRIEESNIQNLFALFLSTVFELEAKTENASYLPQNSHGLIMYPPRVGPLSSLSVTRHQPPSGAGPDLAMRTNCCRLDTSSSRQQPASWRQQLCSLWLQSFIAFIETLLLLLWSTVNCILAVSIGMVSSTVHSDDDQV